MSAIRKTEASCLPGGARQPGAEPRGPAAAGATRAVTAGLSAVEYEKWLLPPEPRSGLERGIHLASLAAGVIALTGGAAAMWLVL